MHKTSDLRPLRNLLCEPNTALRGTRNPNELKYIPVAALPAPFLWLARYGCVQRSRPLTDESLDDNNCPAPEINQGLKNVASALRKLMANTEEDLKPAKKINKNALRTITDFERANALTDELALFFDSAHVIRCTPLLAKKYVAARMNHALTQYRRNHCSVA
jgi:hypothetical protein